MRIHREGRFIIPISLLIIIALIVGGFFLDTRFGYVLLVAGGVLFALILHFFRNPKQEINQDPGAILAPCDGEVVVIEQVEDDRFFQGPMVQLSIFMSPLNVHVNRNPISGKVLKYTYYPGKYLMAFNPKSSTDNEQNYVVVEQDGFQLAYKQIAGFMARRICCYLKEGDSVAQGEEFGFIKFGSRVDILIPLGTPIEVNLGDKVTAGKTVVARKKTVAN
ncbi:MAG: phosphatidylserine decarboxylase family protein [Bacteroidota bacterium]